MPEQTDGLEQQVENIILASFAEQQDTDAIPQDEQNETKEDKRVIDVDLYRLEGGAVLLVPNNGQNPLDTNAVESIAATTDTCMPPETPPTTESSPVEQEEAFQEQETGSVTLIGTKRQVKPSSLFVSLVLLLILAVCAGSYLYLLPLAASATITIIPTAKSLQREMALTITQNPKPEQVQGRELEAISFTKSMTVPATGHAHEDATSAQGVITFYNADSSPYTIPAGVSFRVQGLTLVTATSATVQAAIPPSFGVALAAAQVVQTGVAGNIAAHTLYTRCCGSSFVTATNTNAFSGGQDARDYSFIQTNDVQNGAKTLLESLTPKTSQALNKEIRSGEQLVTPLCTPQTTTNQQAGTAAASVTVSVTQTCTSVAYRTDSLNVVVTSTLARARVLANYEQVGTTQITVNGSTSSIHGATLKVSVSGVWVYRFPRARLEALTRSIAGESQQEAKATMEKIDGVAQVSIHLSRLDFQDRLPTDPQHITIQWVYLVS